MKILYFNNGSGLGEAKSGGTTRLIETSRRMIMLGIPVTIVTTTGSLKLFKNENLQANFIEVRSSLYKKKEKNNFDRMLSYVISTIHSLLIIKNIQNHHIVISPSDYFCDVIPVVFYKVCNPKVKMVSMIHHLCRNPFERKGNLFINLVSYLCQRLSFSLIRIFADKIFLYETPEGSNIGNYFKNKTNIITKVKNGISVEFIESIPEQTIKYDACFIGGLRGSKGIYDLVEIWKNVLKIIPGAKLAIIGEGSKSITDNLVLKFENEGIKQDCVFFHGALPRNLLYKTMKSCKIFISTSYEEGWGIAVSEALASGMHVITYNLPAFNIFKDFIDQCDIGDKESMSKKIIQRLQNYDKKLIIQKKRRDFIKKYSWDAIANEEIIIFKKLLFKIH